MFLAVIIRSSSILNLSNPDASLVPASWGPHSWPFVIVSSRESTASDKPGGGKMLCQSKESLVSCMSLRLLNLLVSQPFSRSCQHPDEIVQHRQQLVSRRSGPISQWRKLGQIRGHPSVRDHGHYRVALLTRSNPTQSRPLEEPVLQAWCTGLVLFAKMHSCRQIP